MPTFAQCTRMNGGSNQGKSVIGESIPDLRIPPLQDHLELENADEADIHSHFAYVFAHQYGNKVS